MSGIAGAWGRAVRYGRRTARHLWWNVDPLPVDMASGLTCLAWALMLAYDSPFDREAYRYFKLLAGEPVWIAMFACCGTIQLGRIVAGLPRESFSQQVIGCAAAFIWLYIACSFLLVFPDSAASSVYLVLAWGSMWAFIRSGRGGGRGGGRAGTV